jgi:hypothetical protein
VRKYRAQAASLGSAVAKYLANACTFSEVRVVASSSKNRLVK